MKGGIQNKEGRLILVWNDGTRRTMAIGLPDTPPARALAEKIKAEIEWDWHIRQYDLTGVSIMSLMKTYSVASIVGFRQQSQSKDPSRLPLLRSRKYLMAFDRVLTTLATMVRCLLSPR
jgi:hypothetical protein